MGALRKGPAPWPPAQPSVTSSHEAGMGTRGTRANPAAVAPRRLERLGRTRGREGITQGGTWLWEEEDGAEY